MEEGSGWYSGHEELAEQDARRPLGPTDWSTTLNSSPPSTRPPSVSAATAPFSLPPLAQAFGSSPPASPRLLSDLSLRHSEPSRSQQARSLLPSEDNDPASPRPVKRRRLREDSEQACESRSANPRFSASGPRAPVSHYEEHSPESRLGATRAVPHQRGITSFSPHLQASAIQHHHSEHTASRSACCPPACGCRECIALRSTLAAIVLEAKVLDAQLASTLLGGAVPEKPFPNVGQTRPREILEWLLALLRENNARLQDDSAKQQTHQQEAILTEAYAQRESNHTLEAMKRGQEGLDPPSDESARRQPFPYPAESSRPRLAAAPAPLPLEEAWKPQPNVDPPSAGYSPRRTASAASSVYAPSPSPMQAPSGRTLPSPTSMNFPAPPSLAMYPSQTPPAPSPAAHTAHLQDLQHQVSVKTLALQTLQREYDSLLQKLERQRTRSLALERKFEVSDVEINSLTDEKEKLQVQVIALEAQVAELTQGRDEARRQLVANGAQYMKIVEMASQLQAQGADDKKRWDREKEELASRIRILEASVSQTTVPTRHTGTASAQSTSERAPQEDLGERPVTADASSSPSDPTVGSLRMELNRLRLRNESLENILRTLRDESKSMEEAAQGVVGVGERIRTAIDKVLEP